MVFWIPWSLQGSVIKISEFKSYTNQSTVTSHTNQKTHAKLPRVECASGFPSRNIDYTVGILQLQQTYFFFA